jgi:hypothetical protein
MDRLDELLDAAGPLLRRVDDILARAGAPADHRVWTELRRVRLLPTDAARSVAALRPGDLAGAGPQLRAHAGAYGTVAAGLPGPGDWSGAAADAYDDARRRIASRLSGEADSLDERLAASADLAEALADWMRSARADLARALAAALGSAEAVTLSAAPDPPGRPQVLAAAETAAHVLRTVADACDRAEDLLYASTALEAETPM